MPTKLESLKEERKRLSKRENLSVTDEKRLRQLDGLIRSEERRNIDRLGDRAMNRGRALITPWNAAERTGSVVGAGYKRIAGGNVGYGMSAGQKMRRDQIRDALGLGAAFEQAGFLNATNDENTGAFTGFETSSMYRDFRFGPGAGGPQAQRAGSSLVGRNLTMMTGMSVRDVMEFYASLSEDELVKLQTEMVDAGLYGDNTPQLGYRDANTAEALTSLMIGWAQNPDKSLPDIMKDLKSKRSAELREKMAEKYGSGVGVVSDEVANISVTDTNTLSSLADRVAVELLGKQLDPDRKAQLVAQIQDEEKSYKMGQATTAFNQDVAKATKAAGGPADIDQFISALIGQESGGNANAVNADSGAMGLGQIMPENWGPWAAEAGVNPADFSPANQMKVIRHKIAQYYETYGNWRDVAIAWYGGAGGVQRVRAGGGYGDEAGYPSLRAYADSVLSKMNASTGASLAQPSPTLGFNVTEDLGSDEARIRRRIIEQEPLRYASQNVAKQAEGFFSLLRGVN